MFSSKLHPDGVFEFVIDHPPVNAFGIAMLRQLSDEIGRAGSQGDARSVMLRSAGRGFCAGGDVKEVEQLGGFAGILGQAEGTLALTTAILECEIPVVCAVHNYCVGVGVLVAGSADIVLASVGTRFVLAEVDNGATTGAVHALKLMPEKRARAAMMTAEPIFAEELHAFGTVLRVVPEGELAAEAYQVAHAIAMKPTASMRRLKEAFNDTTRAREVRSLYRAELSYTYELNIMGVASDGRAAFVDKTRPGY